MATIVAKATGSWSVKEGQSPSVSITLNWGGDTTLAQNSTDAVWNTYFSGKTITVQLISNGTVVMTIGVDATHDTVTTTKGQTTISIDAKSTKQFQQDTTITEIQVVSE